MMVILQEIVEGEIITINNEPDNPKRFNETINAYVKNSESILIDITSFTRLFLYSLLNITLLHNKQSDILYSEPQEYTMNFSQGLEKIIILPNYPGIPDQSKKVLMIMFLGWESRRAESVVEEFDPDLLITFYETSQNNEREKWNAITIEQCKKLLESSETNSVSALTPNETIAKLEEIYEVHHDEYDICIVNIGPKSQCLAIAEFSQNHEDVQVLYPKPYKWTQELPEDEIKDPVSSGIGRTFFFQYPLMHK
ncbi:hypothetical protein NKOR_08030 [Candidatus Nitrosopumilus koreensis AR1]|uniref:Uncharacterized protein n=3 Tax=Nitrosopumilus TaxID=338191 RepID=K0B8M7_9ARCH|nr:hypothetical protein NKOR_08030 [Candidatus Nitrosopumilus koreensis AR1]